MREMKLVCSYCESANIAKIETNNDCNRSYYCFDCDEKFDTCILDNGYLYALNTKRYVYETKKELLKEIKELRDLVEKLMEKKK